MGLMVCCDQCEVWQHCECMGLDEDEIPEQYFCEQCRPSDHVEIKGYDNKTRRYYKPSSTTNSLPNTTEKLTQASISLEEVLAFRNAIEQSKSYDETSKSTNSKAKHNTKENPTLDRDIQQLQATKQTRPKRSEHSKKSDDQQKSPRNNHKEKKTRQRSNNAPRQYCANQLFEHFSSTARASSPPAKVRYPSHKMSIQEMTRLEMASGKRNHRLIQDNDDDTNEEDDADEFSHQQKRRQLLDARISEAMTKAALELDKEEEEKNLAIANNKGRRPTPILIPGHNNNNDTLSSPTSSLSSAKKGVAEEVLERIRGETIVDKNEQTSIEIMDLLTKEVIIFQRRFGSFSYNNGHANNHIQEDDESDGPVTRSSSQQNRYLMDRW
ncbi:uncharacterized protein BX663DRAFT_518795 [Cokeromyces recurvatus]|uniref:uncharacterized protein n=1 Tax=Cokeromyces recurvatus TaxID=90255 RepID=UPI00221E6B50|nr:uncharacterized protein BX663DRAFT_522378 [Cokeromyces recurvatus]XP_051380142.1 uncharacterized protein BX663DRAFT_518795 [Cokeromyces recurvatus]KAI7899127.1 hypothetical protein BX663DRAFT_522378 [Cokeromyces recurvatus]KAI7900157.1 hypothetical protein BX663DRAFT_518795 [Cokeromyces recurvatus]